MRNGLACGCRWLCNAMTSVSVVLLMLLALPITYDATARAFGHPTIWVFEVTMYALIATGFLANPVATRSGAHFRVTLLHKLFPRWRRALNVFSHLMTLLFAAILVGAGIYFVWYSWSNGIRSATLLGVPLWIPQLALPVGGVGLFLQTLAFLLTGEEPSEEDSQGVGD
jgi:C4-dicarboxylate transporter, DctQ subunit